MYVCVQTEGNSIVSEIPKVAVVTGAMGDIGRSIVAELISLNYFVYALDRIERKGGMLGSDCCYLEVDICCRKSIEEVIDKIHQSHNQVDLFVNNAAQSSASRLLETSEDEWDSVMNTNLNAVFSMTKMVVARMKSRRAGQVINISSVDGVGKNNNVAYATSKAGLLRFTEVVAKTYGINRKT